MPADPEMIFASPPAAPEPERPAPPPPRRPTQAATIVPVTNGFVLVIGGGPVAVAGLEEEQLGRLAQEWARGAYGG